MVLKPKQCSVCKKLVAKLWRSNPKTCQQCAMREKVSQTAPKGPTKPRQPIKSISDKQDKLNKAYSALRKVFLEQHPFCMAQLNGCTGVSTDVHHMKGRGEYLLDTATWMSSCRLCHSWIESHSAEAKELGLSQSRLNK